MSALNQYLLAAGSPPATKGGILEEWIQIYNNTGTAIANGAIKVVGYYAETTASVFAGALTTDPGIVAVPLAPATQATVNKIGVVDNDTQEVAGTPVTTYEGIQDKTTGWLKLKGIVQALVNGSSAVALGDTLKATNGGTAFVKDVAATSGASGIPGILSCAVCLAAYSTGNYALKYVYLIGHECGI